MRFIHALFAHACVKVGPPLVMHVMGVVNNLLTDEEEECLMTIVVV